MEARLLEPGTGYNAEEEEESQKSKDENAEAAPPAPIGPPLRIMDDRPIVRADSTDKLLPNIRMLFPGTADEMADWYKAPDLNESKLKRTIPAVIEGTAFSKHTNVQKIRHAYIGEPSITTSTSTETQAHSRAQRTDVRKKNQSPERQLAPPPQRATAKPIYASASAPAKDPEPLTIDINDQMSSEAIDAVLAHRAAIEARVAEILSVPSESEARKEPPRLTKAPSMASFLKASKVPSRLQIQALTAKPQKGVSLSTLNKTSNSPRAASATSVSTQDSASKLHRSSRTTMTVPRARLIQSPRAVPSATLDMIDRVQQFLEENRWRLHQAFTRIASSGSIPPTDSSASNMNNTTTATDTALSSSTSATILPLSVVCDLLHIVGGNKRREPTLLPRNLAILVPLAGYHGNLKDIAYSAIEQAVMSISGARSASIDYSHLLAQRAVCVQYISVCLYLCAASVWSCVLCCNS
jgi:hypothetical protein